MFKPWEFILFNTGEGTGGGEGGEGGDEGGNHDTSDIGVDVLRSATMRGLDESYHDEWTELSGRIQSPSDFAKNYVEAQRYAKSAVKLPGKDAQPSELDAFYNKIGRPEKPDLYQFTDTFGEGDNTYNVTEQDKAFREAFRPVAHRARLTQSQVRELEAFQFENNQVMADAREAKAEDIRAHNEKVLKERYGPDFEKNRNMHIAAAKNYSGNNWDDLASMKLEDGTFFLDHPVAFQMFSQIGMERQEDFRNPNEFNESARSDAKTEYDKIRAEAISKGLSPTHPLWPADELQKLSDRINGTANVGGRQSVSN